MRESLLEILVDPVSGAPLRLEERARLGGEVDNGELVANGSRYPVRAGIPRFVLTEDEGQRQTESSFGYKWTKLDSFGSEGMKQELHAWFLRRYGFRSAEEMRSWFAARRRTLDAGCGAGFSTSAWMADGWNAAGAEWVGADISAAIDVARERLNDFGGTHFVQADVLQLPFKPGSFEAIISEGVLHHTPSTARAMKSLVPLLAPGGELMFYVYRRKAPIREFTDDHVRGLIADMSPEEAWDALRPLTRLGQALAELETEVEVPEDVPLLGIKAGRYDVQRLVYWHVAKLFWNAEMTFEENNHLNFDWYAPRYAHRHTEEEVRGWCADEGLEITHFDVDDAGFTVRAVKPG
ncbi:MAG: methyltransferase domain-containing protein [Gaiellaceae bacterium]